MEAIDTKAMKDIRSYLERRGFEILEERWAHGGDAIDFIGPFRICCWPPTGWGLARSGPAFTRWRNRRQIGRASCRERV